MGLILILVILLSPAIAMITPMYQNRNKDKIIFFGMIASWLGALGVIFAFWYGGFSISDNINKIIETAQEEIIKDARVIEFIKTNNMTNEVFLEDFKKSISLAVSLIPSVIVMIGSIITIIEYKVIRLLFFRKNKNLIFKINEYKLNKTVFFKWCLLFVMAYFISLKHDIGVVAKLNIEVILRTMIILEGILAIYDIGVKGYRYNKILVSIVVVLVVLSSGYIPYASILLVVLGLASTIYQLRNEETLKRFKR